MNHYGAMARDHWARYRPTEYEAMADRAVFFAELGEHVSARIDALSHSLTGDDCPGEGSMEKLGRLRTARMMAEEQILLETLPVTAYDEQDETLEPTQTSYLPRRG